MASPIVLKSRLPDRTTSSRRRRCQEVSGDWYDWPQYVDLLFRSETRREVGFIESACRRYASGKVRRVVEFGSGGGRLVVALAKRGYEMTAVETNAKAVAHLRRRLADRGLTADVRRADMADFHLGRPVDAAVCTFNTFRHLLTEARAARHLRLVADRLRPGGIYILGLHLLPEDVAEESCERWSVRHGHLRLSATLRVVATDRRRRRERLAITLRAQTPRRRCTIRSEFALRMYTAAQFRSLLRREPRFQLADVFDFWYEIDHPLRLDDDITDTVAVLRRL